MPQIISQNVLLYADHKAKTIKYVTLDDLGMPMSWRLGHKGVVESCNPYKMVNPKHEPLGVVPYRTRKGRASVEAKRLKYAKDSGL